MRSRDAIDPWSEHEVIDDQLTPPLEQIDQARFAVPRFELIVLVNRHHRLPASLGCQRVSCTRRRFFLGQESFVSSFPLSWRHNFRKGFGALGSHDGVTSFILLDSHRNTNASLGYTMNAPSGAPSKGSAANREHPGNRN